MAKVKQDQEGGATILDTEGEQEPAGGAEAVPPAPRIPQVGDTVHFYRSAFTNRDGMSRSRIYSEPSTITRVVRPGDPRSSVNLIIANTMVHERCRPVVARRGQIDRNGPDTRGRWAISDPDGNIDPFDPYTQDKPAVGASNVVLYTANSKGVTEPVPVEVLDAHEGEDIVALTLGEPEQIAEGGVPFAGDGPRDRSWGWEPSAASEFLKNGKEIASCPEP